MYGLTIVSKEKGTVIADGSQVINVEAHIFLEAEGKKPKVVEVKKFSYPYDATAKEIKADLSKCLAEFIRTEEARSSQEASDEIEKKVDKTLEKLEDFTI